MQVTPELCTLLKVMPKAHLELQAMLIDVQQYKPTWAIGGASPPCLKSWTSQAALQASGRMSRMSRLTWMLCTAKSALGKVSLPPKACFVLGKVVHV